MLEKFCKRNIIHHFLINENTTTPISMGSKIKLPNTLLKQSWKKLRARECCSFLAGNPRAD